jgi:microcystin-dependent protein
MLDTTSDQYAAISGNTATKGTGYAHDVMQPFVLVNYIIKT